MSRLYWICIVFAAVACSTSSPPDDDDDDSGGAMTSGGGLTSSSGGDSLMGPHADRCSVACDIPVGPCSAEDALECGRACVAATDGLSASCAQCITENTGWHGTVCDGDDRCSFGPGANFCDSEPDDPCQPSDEICRGYELGSVNDCSEFCN